MATTAHGLVYPDDYTDKADVPTTLQSMVESIETALTAQDTERASLVTQMQANGPLGMIVAYGGTAAPTGWKLCDGTAHGQPSGSALYTLLGGPNVPNLQDRFIVGAGSGYQRGATGGEALVTLTAAQSGLPAHTHTASSGVESSDHAHTFTSGGMNSNTVHTHGAWSGGQSADHSHGAVMYEGTGYGNGWTVGGAYYTSGPPFGSTYGASNDHTHGVGVADANIDHTHSGTTNGRTTAHQHAITVAAASPFNASLPHENRPPYYALVYIIKVV